MKSNSGFPEYVEWQITGKCNLHCIHCSAADRREVEDLSTPEAISIIHELLEEPIKSVTLSGGEPLLRDDWELLTGILKENGVSVQIISNGHFLDETVARKLQQHEVNFIWLSLDGPQQAHNTIRQHADAYTRVMTAASLLEEFEVPYGFMTTLLSTNYDQLAELCEIVCETNAALWQLWLGNKCNHHPIWLKPAEIHQILGLLPRLRLSCPGLIIGDNIGYKESLEPLRTPGFMDHCQTSNFSGCYGANTVLGIRNDGSITGCLAMKDCQTPSMHQSKASIQDRYWTAASRHHRLQHELLLQCHGCARLDNCRGGCPAYAIGGGSDNEPRFCYMSTAQKPLRAAALSASLLTLCTLSMPGCGSSAPSPAPDTNMQIPVDSRPAQSTATADTNAVDTQTVSPQAFSTTTPLSQTPDSDEDENRVNISPGIPPAAPTNGSTNRTSAPCMMSHVGCRDVFVSPIIPNDSTKPTE